MNFSLNFVLNFSLNFSLNFRWFYSEYGRIRAKLLGDDALQSLLRMLNISCRLICGQGPHTPAYSCWAVFQDKNQAGGS
jgi:hypothetical protein